MIHQYARSTCAAVDYVRTYHIHHITGVETYLPCVRAHSSNTRQVLLLYTAVVYRQTHRLENCLLYLEMRKCIPDNVLLSSEDYDGCNGKDHLLIQTNPSFAVDKVHTTKSRKKKKNTEDFDLLSKDCTIIAVARGSEATAKETKRPEEREALVEEQRTITISLTLMMPCCQLLGCPPLLVIHRKRAGEVPLSFGTSSLGAELLATEAGEGVRCHAMYAYTYLYLWICWLCDSILSLLLEPSFNN